MSDRRDADDRGASEHGALVGGLEALALAQEGRERVAFVRGERRDDAIEELSRETLGRVDAGERVAGPRGVLPQDPQMSHPLALVVVGLGHGRGVGDGAHRDALREGRREARGEQHPHVLARRGHAERDPEHVDEGVLATEDEVRSQLWSCA